MSVRVRFLHRLKKEQAKISPQPFPAPSQLRNLQTGKVYEPNSEASLGFHCSRKRFVGFFGGLGSGKTAAGSIEALKRIRSGLPGAIISPDYSHFVRSAFEEFSQWCPWDHVVKQNRSEKWWLFDTGSKVFYGGIDDPDSYRGPNLNWIWFDEGARKTTDEAWKVLIGRIRIGRDPQIFITTTPRPHWLKKYFVTSPPRAKNGESYSEYFTSSTLANKENLDAGYYDSLLSAYSGAWARQELGGEFVAFEGLVYENLSLSEFPNGNIYPVDPTPESLKDYPIELAIDDGFQVDPRAILVIQKRPDYIHVLFEQVHLKHLEERCIDEICASCDSFGWGLPEMAVFSHERPSLAVRLREKDIPGRSKGYSRLDGVSKVRRLICDSRDNRTILIHPRCSRLIEELSELYVYDVDVPRDGDDDCCDALRMWVDMRIR